MTATSDPSTETTTVLEQSPQASMPLAARRFSRRDLLLWGGLGTFAGLATGAVVSSGPIYARRHTDRVYPGVAVAGVSLAGLTRAEALARLTAEGQRYAAQPLQFTGSQAGASWSASPGELGVRFDYATAIDRALATHRGASRWERYTGAFAALWPASRPATHALPVAIDEQLLLQRLQAWADGATTLPTDAFFSSSADGQLVITPDQAGRGIAFEPTYDAIVDRAARFAPGPIPLGMAPVGATITAERLRELLTQAQSIVAQPLGLENQGRRWALETAQLRAAIGYRVDGDRLALTIDTAGFRPMLQATARAVAVAPTNARIVRGNDGRFSITPERAGAVLDEAATLAAIERALLTGPVAAGRGVALVLKPEPPAITTADVEPNFKRLDAILNTPLVIAFQEYTLTLNRGDILPLLVLEETPTAAEKLTIKVDQEQARALAGAIANALKKEPRDAQFRWLNGSVQATTPPEDGRTVEVEPTAQALMAAILGATGTATPVVTAVKPKVDGAAQAGVIIRERLTSGDTAYAGIASRRHNVELSMERLNGALVPPDGVFSFNQAVGAQTVENGYQAAYGIAMVGGAGGQAKTVSSIGGGICQVSTTLFQAVYHAGLPVEERNWHLYWINSYGLPPSGLKGLDATVDDQSLLDFKFRNTTGNWLAVEAAAEGGRVKIALHGTNPGWQVQIDPPAISNERKADPTMVTEKTHDLPPGQTLQVESAVDGFDAANHTVVRDGAGNVLRDVTFRSSYIPSRNVTQVGVPASEPLT